MFKKTITYGSSQMMLVNPNYLKLLKMQAIQYLDTQNLYHQMISLRSRWQAHRLGLNNWAILNFKTSNAFRKIF